MRTGTLPWLLPSQIRMFQHFRMEIVADASIVPTLYCLLTSA